MLPKKTVVLMWQLSTIPGSPPEMRAKLRRNASEITYGARRRNLLDARDGVAAMRGLWSRRRQARAISLKGLFWT